MLASDTTTTDPDLRLIVDRRVVRATAVDGFTHWFGFSQRPRRVRIVSRDVVPALAGTGADQRRLGVALRRIIVRSATFEMRVAQDAPQFADGFHGSSDGARFTDGDALLPDAFVAWASPPFEIGVELWSHDVVYPPRPRRALVIDATTPTPDRDAGSNVILWHMRLLQDLGFHITFVPQDNFAFIPDYTPALQARGIDTVFHPNYREIGAYLHDHARSFELVYGHRWEIIERCLPALRRYIPDVPLLFNTADLHFLREQRVAELGRAPGGFGVAAATRTRELAVIAAADCTLLCNTEEMALVREALPHARLRYLPWVTQARTDRVPSHAARRDIMFLGGFGHPPNVDAVQWFVAEVMPVVRAELPEMRLHIYGAGMPDEIAALARDDVVVGGYVPELGPVFDRHRAMVAPLRVGAGFKGKVAEALAHGVPVIASPIAAEGTGLEDGISLLVASDARAFADAILRLENDPGLWSLLSGNGLAHVSAHFSPERGRAHLAEIIRAIGRDDLLEPA